MHQIDSKAKRIVQKGSKVAVIIENKHASEGINIMLVLRQLSQVRGTR